MEFRAASNGHRVAVNADLVQCTEELDAVTTQITFDDGSLEVSGSFVEVSRKLGLIPAAAKPKPAHSEHAKNGHGSG